MTPPPVWVQVVTSASKQTSTWVLERWAGAGPNGAPNSWAAAVGPATPGAASTRHCTPHTAPAPFAGGRRAAACVQDGAGAVWGGRRHLWHLPSGAAPRADSRRWGALARRERRCVRRLHRRLPPPDCSPGERRALLLTPGLPPCSCPCFAEDAIDGVPVTDPIMLRWLLYCTTLALAAYCPTKRSLPPLRAARWAGGGLGGGCAVCARRASRGVHPALPHLPILLLSPAPRPWQPDEVLVLQPRTESTRPAFAMGVDHKARKVVLAFRGERPAAQHTMRAVAWCTGRRAGGGRKGGCALAAARCSPSRPALPSRPPVLPSIFYPSLLTPFLLILILFCTQAILT